MKPATKSVRGPLVDFRRRADLLDCAALHQHDPVGKRHRLQLVVGDIDGGGLEALVQAGDLDAHVVAQLGIEVGERFIKEEYARRLDHGAGDRHALLLAAGEFGRLAQRGTVPAPSVSATALMRLSISAVPTFMRFRPKAMLS